MYVLIYLHHIMKKFQKTGTHVILSLECFRKIPFSESKCIITDGAAKVNIYKHNILLRAVSKHLPYLYFYGQLAPHRMRHIHAAERKPAASAHSAAGTAQRLSFTPAAVKYTAMT